MSGSASLDSLPAEIVRRLLERGSEVAARSAARAAGFASAREAIRKELEEYIVQVPDEWLDAAEGGSVAAVDGGMVCDSKSIGDLCTAAAVSVGPGDSDGDCEVWMDSVIRSPQNKEALGGIMSSMEVALAARSAAQVVMIDGSMLSTLINVSKGVHASRRTGGPLAVRMEEARSEEFRAAVMSVLRSPRHIAMPKYTTTNEFEECLPEEFRKHDARTVVTMALRPGEMTHFAVRTSDERDDARRMLIGPALGFRKDELDAFSEAVGGVYSCYYRPHPWAPAFRIDMTEAGYRDPEAQARALRAVRDTTRASGLREPFPLYLVDLFAKQVSVGASPVVEMAALSSIDDPDARLLLAMGYRT